MYEELLKILGQQQFYKETAVEAKEMMK